MRPLCRLLRPLPLLALLLSSCAGIGRYPSLGTYYVDETRIAVLELERPDTLGFLVFADSVEVIDAPLEDRTSDDLFIVRTARGFGRAERDLLMSDILFRSKYSRGRPVATAADGGRYYLDEFGDTVEVAWRGDVVETPEAEVVTEKPATRAKSKAKKKSKKRR